MSQGKSPTQYLGVLPQNPPNVIKAQRVPTSSDTAYQYGDLWLDVPDEAVWMYDGAGIWISLGSGMIGAIDTLTGNTGGAVGPNAGHNISVVGSGTVSVVGNTSTNTLTVSIPNSVIPFFEINGTNTLARNTGYFANAASTLTLPSSGSGDLVIVICTSSSAVEIIADAGHSIELSSSQSSVSGNITNTKIGDTISLRFSTLAGIWFAESSIGNWIIA